MTTTSTSRFLSIAAGLFSGRPQEPQETPAPRSTLPAPRVIARAALPAVPAPRVLESEFDVVRSLTACLDGAPCRGTARRIFRVLFGLGMHVARAQGMSAAVSRVVFHLPAELVYSHLDLGKSAFYDNLRYLIGAGLVACDAHMARLKGHRRNVASGTLWAVSLAPERVLGGQRAPVRLTAEDWRHNWRDLQADVNAGRTVAALLGIEKAAPKAAEDADQDGTELSSPESAGQSSRRKRLLTKWQTLKEWAINPFLSNPSDKETVRETPALGMDAVWGLGAGSTPRRDRGALVDRQARRLAAAFGDGENSLGFWRALVWNITRGQDSGEDVSEDVSVVLARVLRDVQHDLEVFGKLTVNPGKLVNVALSRGGLLDVLRGFKLSAPHVGRRPVIAA